MQLHGCGSRLCTRASACFELAFVFLCGRRSSVVRMCLDSMCVRRGLFVEFKLALFLPVAHLQAVSPPSPPLAPLFFQCDGSPSSLLRGGSWLSCQYLPAMGAVSILELPANSGSSWMSQAPNLHLGMQLLMRELKYESLSQNFFNASFFQKTELYVLFLEQFGLIIRSLRQYTGLSMRYLAPVS